MNAKIERGGRIMRRVSTVVLALLPVAVIVALAAHPDGAQLVAVSSGLDVSASITPLQWWGAIAAGLIPTAILMWSIWHMRRLFSLFGQGRVLTVDAARQISRVGQGFLMLSLVPLLVVPAQSVLLTWANPVGERQLSVSVNSHMVGFAVVSALLILIGWAMAQAADVATENESFV